MKTRIKIAASAALISPLLLVGGVYAQPGNGNGSGRPVAQAETPPPTPTTTTTETPPETVQAELKKRLDERKVQQKVKLNAAELRRLQQRCKPAQGQIKKVGDKAKANLPQRHKAYENLAAHLTTLIEKLDTAGVDTADLKNQQTVLSDKLAKYKAESLAYQQALDDLSIMDCAADPTAFKASLEAARKLREGLTTTITDIRTYVMETVKPTLVIVRKSVAEKQTEGGE